MVEFDAASSDQWQEAMLKACSAGRLDELQILFNEHGIKPGSPAIRYYERTSESAPTTSHLFAAAISHGHQPIVRHLYSVYPEVEISDGVIPDALLKPPLNPDMLKLVCSHTPEIAFFEYEDHMTSLLGKACEGGADNAPFIHVLLDHGALSKMTHNCTSRMGGPLTRAVECGQPIDVVSKMARDTSHLDFPINSALFHRRADVLDVLLTEKRTRGRSSPIHLLRARSWLEGEKNKDMIHVLKRHIKSCEQQLAESPQRGLQATRKDDAKQWWPFGGIGTEAKGKIKDQRSSTAVESEGPSKSWWPLSKKGNKLESADVQHREKMKRVDYLSSDEDTGKDG
ncbi:uncharacterized protein Z519_09293 [Cladophialophora bantiana CBS 173.52]|uniref:Ankyrin repeat protein n=1 Tax=Cladophialophora bantiana (strain ATCC 10958 / CBS 173.52 / CDC B-1940 / NIH 8579) TaxID=1442370 RepID=A0A0D2HZ40_CLAB1|nr:uncharacterized protein Z519_09293 [Cladophialophora bantiana CBS 173.52]KIW89864.1 hypothetical protein Z519_09293 [Cladophialophora bantiana CBS 173.52]